MSMRGFDCGCYLRYPGSRMANGRALGVTASDGVL
jgi:hypothetical protein